MPDIFTLSRFLLIPTDRCNLRCKLCSEDIPLNKPEPNMTVPEARRILKAFFEVVDRIGIMHISGGGEPFLHKELHLLIEECIPYRKQFDSFIIFTNGTIVPPEILLKTLAKHKELITVRVSDYGIRPEYREKLYVLFDKYGVTHRKLLYHGKNQDYGGWVDYGDFSPRSRTSQELKKIYRNCASYRDLSGNWRARDGEVHFCSRAARGAQLGFIPKNKDDCVDLFDEILTREEKQKKFTAILSADYINACNYCNGDYGTDDNTKRYPAGKQL